MEFLNFTEAQAREVIETGYISFKRPGIAEQMAPGDPIAQHWLKHGPVPDIEDL